MAGGDDRITVGLFIAAFATVVLGAAWNAALFAAGRKARRALRWEAEGKCPTCGYDLRENQSGICPECGKRIWD
jgi:hypothetical protein